ncbi:hypothetical protein ACFFWC_30605 [Plantactinospora siamensis]|uniref:Nitrate/nitrite sensing protein domain-containing protein n=1 Tax=Plantactinospora siamensis TaxID=555372 RepID=A0ABV6P633_9ACTN
MSDRTTPAAPRPSAPGITLPLVLAIALLLPVAVLFTQVWRDVDGDRTTAARERDGVAYLQALWPLTSALADAQSAVVTGRQVARESLDRAVGQANSADDRWGEALRTRDRWATIRTKIDALPQRPGGSVPETVSAYQEVTDLLLALYGKVQDSSGMARDPEEDSAMLQDVSARDLPAALISAGRLADAVQLAAARPAAEQLSAVTELTAAGLATFQPANDAVTDLQAAIDSTENTNLGGNLLSRLDAYQRAMGGLAGATTLPGLPGAAATGQTRGARVALPDAAKVATARETAQRAAADLGTIVLAELDSLIRDRADHTGGRRWLALGAAALAVLLVAAVVTAAVLAARRRAARERIAAVAAAAGLVDPAPREEDRPVAGGPPTGLPGADQRRWEPLDWVEPVPVGPGSNAHPAPAAAVRDNQPARWGR